MAEIVLGGVGAAIGSSIPGVGWMTGFNIGVTLGSLLFPPSGPKLERGRLDEIRIQGAQQGSPIALIYGRNRTAGTIIWATGLIETSKSSTVGGKGGGGGTTTTEYSYSTSLAIVVCEGTISKIRRIWANETVIYDWRTGGSPTIASFLDPSKLRVYLGGQTTADAAIEADKGAGNVPAHKGLCYVVFEDFPLAEFGNQIPNYTFEVESGHASLEVAMQDLAERVGIGSSKYDFSALSSYPTRGMLVGARTEASRVMEAFAKANFFELVESQGQLKAVVRDGVSTLTIPADDIGTAEAEETDSPRCVETVRSEETELPREFTVSYSSELIDFLSWTQTARRSTRWSENQEQISLPMGLDDEYARYLADALLMERWAARSSHRFSLPYKYLRLDPGDVVTITDEAGSARTVRILGMSMGLLAQIEVDAVDDDPIIYVDPGLPASLPSGGGAGVASPDAADLLLFEANAPYDILADAPQIGAVAGRNSAGWKGGRAEVDPLLEAYGGGSFRTVAEFASSSVFGYTTADAFGVLPDLTDLTTLGSLDATSTVRVTLVSGTLASCTYDELVTEGRNLALVGGEILQFQTATLVSGSTYTLSNLLRYRRGTDYLIGLVYRSLASGHAQAEPFVLFDSKVKNFAYGEGFIGSTLESRLIENGKDYSGGLPAYAEPLDLEGLSRKPYSPVDLRYSGDRSAGAVDVSLYWTRRVRKKGELVDYAEAPLDEASEAYDVEIWSDDLVDLWGTYTHTGSSPFVFSVAYQAATLPGNVDFQFIVRQRSEEPGIGAGYDSYPKFVSTADDVDF